jgi:hypothetical protein
VRVFYFKAGKGARGGAPKCQIQIVLLSDLAIKPCQMFDCSLALPGVAVRWDKLCSFGVIFSTGNCLKHVRTYVRMYAGSRAS